MVTLPQKEYIAEALALVALALVYMPQRTELLVHAFLDHPSRSFIISSMFLICSHTERAPWPHRSCYSFQLEDMCRLFSLILLFLHPVLPYKNSSFLS